MNKALIGIAAIAALIGTPVLAADMPLKAPPPPAPAWNWTGFYVGINGGADWFDKSWYVPDTPTNIAGGCALPGCNFSAGSHSSSGGLLGGQAGFNYQINRWVLGVEAQGDWTHLQGSNQVTVIPTSIAEDIVDNSKTDLLAKY